MCAQMPVLHIIIVCPIPFRGKISGGYFVDMYNRVILLKKRSRAHVDDNYFLI